MQELNNRGQGAPKTRAGCHRAVFEGQQGAANQGQGAAPC